MEDLKPNPSAEKTGKETLASYRRSRPVQSDFFRHLALFHAHFSPEPLRSQYSQFLPSYLRPGNLEKYLSETQKPQLFGNKFWWVAEGVPEPVFREAVNGENIRNDGCTTTASNQNGTDEQMDRSCAMEVENSSEMKNVQATVYEGLRGFDVSQALVGESKRSDHVKAKDELSSAVEAGGGDQTVLNAMELEALPERAKVDSTLNNHSDVNANVGVGVVDDGRCDHGAKTVHNQVVLSDIESFLMNEFDYSGPEQLNKEDGASAFPNHLHDLLSSAFSNRPSNNLGEACQLATEGMPILEMGPENPQPNLKGNKTGSEANASLGGALEEGEIPERDMIDGQSANVDVQYVTTGKGNLGDGQDITSNHQEAGQEINADSMDCQVQALKVGLKERKNGKKEHKLEVTDMKRARKDKKDQSKNKKRSVQVVDVANKRENHVTTLSSNGKPQGESEKECEASAFVKKLQQSRSSSHEFVQYSRDQLLQLRRIDVVPEDIVQMRCFIEAELLGGHQKRRNGLEDSSKKRKKSPTSVDNRAVQKVAKISTKDGVSVNQKQQLKVDTTTKKEVAKIYTEDGISVNHKQQPKVDTASKKEVAKISTEDGISDQMQQPKVDTTSKKEVAKISTEDGISVNQKQQPKVDTLSKQEVDDIPLKKKRGPASAKRKAKKKIKERKKRAEKNRKLGVKRLKIQTIVKPKPVVHCRHYLMGRCHEGEKCKFSHDVVPLTKSKPCCFFAKQSCMKGDDCPFDHELSKYPCNNIVNSGFCSRGESCLFSHKIKPKEDAATTNSALDSNEKSSVPSTTHSDPKPQVNSVLSSLLKTAKNVKDSLTVGHLNKPAQLPRGMSFVSFGKDNSNQHKQPQLSSLDSKADTMLNPPSDITKATPPSLETKQPSSLPSDNLDNNPNTNMVDSHSTGNVRAENERNSVGPSSNLKTPKGLSFVTFSNSKPDRSSSDSILRVQTASNRMLNPGAIPGGTPPTPLDGKTSFSGSSVLKNTVPLPSDISGSVSTGTQNANCGAFNPNLPKGLPFNASGDLKQDVESTKHKLGNLPQNSVNNDHGANAKSSLSKTSDLFKGEALPVSTPQGTDLLSFSNTPLNIKQARFPFSENRDSIVVSGDPGSAGNIQKPYAVPFKLPASPASADSISSRFENLPGKAVTLTSGQRSLQSTLAFASKFNSSAGRSPSFSTTMVSPLDAGRTSTTSLTESDATAKASDQFTSITSGSAGTSSSGVAQKSKATAIWEILYAGGSGT